MTSPRTDLLLAAVANNIAWCAAVCRASGIGSSTHGDVWVVDGQAPARYPAVVTLRPGADRAEVARLASQSGGAVKDSFDDVDLAEAGCTRLFTATWYGLRRDELQRAPRGECTTAGSAEGLAQWSMESGVGDVLPERLLHVPGFSALLVRHEQQVVAGATVLKTNGFAGVTNMFMREVDPAAVWSTLARHLFADTHVEAVGGYEQGQDLEAVLQAGAAGLGELSVWVGH